MLTQNEIKNPSKFRARCWADVQQGGEGTVRNHREEIFSCRTLSSCRAPQGSLVEVCALPGCLKQKRMEEFCSAEDLAFSHLSPFSSDSIVPLLSCTELIAAAASLPLSQALTLICRMTVRSEQVAGFVAW